VSENPVREEGRRDLAIVRLKKKADFRTHLFVFVVVNTAFVVIWAVMGGPVFWPLLPILLWGMGLIFHARDVYGSHDFTEDEIRREMERMR
jgi:fatty acid desaturase